MKGHPYWPKPSAEDHEDFVIIQTSDDPVERREAEERIEQRKIVRGQIRQIMKGTG